eukprot:2174831-Amphidinium_carterae.2
MFTARRHLLSATILVMLPRCNLHYVPVLGALLDTWLPTHDINVHDISDAQSVPAQLTDI